METRSRIYLIFLHGDYNPVFMAVFLWGILSLLSCMFYANAIIVDTSFNVTVDPDMNPWSLSVCDAGRTGGPGCTSSTYDCDFAGSPPQQYALAWGQSLTCLDEPSGILYIPPSPSTQTYNLGDNLPLGSFYSRNVPVLCATSTAQATINYQFDFPNNPSQNITLVIDIQIDETVNMEPCLYPSVVPCADTHTYIITSPLGDVLLNNNATVNFLFTNGNQNITKIIEEQDDCPRDEPYAAFTIPVIVAISTVCTENGCPLCTVCNLLTGECDSDSIVVDSVDTTFDFQNCMEGDLTNITINVSKGSPPYLYSIDGGMNFQSNNTFNNLSPGVYYLFINGSLGCFSEVYTYIIPGCDGYNGTLSLIDENSFCQTYTSNDTIQLTVEVDALETNPPYGIHDIEILLSFITPLSALFDPVWVTTPSAGSYFTYASGTWTIDDFTPGGNYVLNFGVDLPFGYSGPLTVMACFATLPDIPAYYAGAMACQTYMLDIAEDIAFSKTSSVTSITALGQVVDYTILSLIPDAPSVELIDIYDSPPSDLVCNASIPCYTPIVETYLEEFNTLPTFLGNDYVYNTGTWPIYSFGELVEYVDFDAGDVRVQIDGAFGPSLFLRGASTLNLALARALTAGPISLKYYPITSMVLSFDYRKPTNTTYNLVTYVSTDADDSTWTSIDTVNTGTSLNYTAHAIDVLPYVSPGDNVYFKIQVEFTVSTYYIRNLQLEITYSSLWGPPCDPGPYYALACKELKEYVSEPFDVLSDNLLYGYGTFDMPFDEVGENDNFDLGNIQVQTDGSLRALSFFGNAPYGIATNQSIGPPVGGAFLIDRTINFWYRRSSAEGFFNVYFVIDAITYLAGVIICDGSSDASYTFASYDIRAETVGYSTMELRILYENGTGFGSMRMRDLSVISTWGVQDYVLPDVTPIGITSQLQCPTIPVEIHALCYVDSISSNEMVNCANITTPSYPSGICACNSIAVETCIVNCLCEVGFGETYVSCPDDCSACNGNGICANTESIASCPVDCDGLCNSNGICDSNENYESCAADCPCICNDDGVCELLENTPCSDCIASPCIPNGYCDLDENFSNCPQDCQPCVNNSMCEAFEREWCPDCVPIGGCNNDFICNANESVVLCAYQGTCDCMIERCNMDGSCGYQEDELCPDCMLLPCVSDGKCSRIENLHNCPADCIACILDGDGMCEENELGECQDCHTC